MVRPPDSIATSQRSVVRVAHVQDRPRRPRVRQGEDGRGGGVRRLASPRVLRGSCRSVAPLSGLWRKPRFDPDVSARGTVESATRSTRGRSVSPVVVGSGVNERASSARPAARPSAIPENAARSSGWRRTTNRSGTSVRWPAGRRVVPSRVRSGAGAGPAGGACGRGEPTGVRRGVRRTARWRPGAAWSVAESSRGPTAGR